MGAGEVVAGLIPGDAVATASAAPTTLATCRRQLALLAPLGAHWSAPPFVKLVPLFVLPLVEAQRVSLQREAVGELRDGMVLVDDLLRQPRALLCRQPALAEVLVLHKGEGVFIDR